MAMISSLSSKRIARVEVVPWSMARIFAGMCCALVLLSRVTICSEPGSASQRGVRLQLRNAGRSRFADEREWLILEHGLYRQPRRRWVQAMLRGKIGAVGKDRVDVLLELEALIMILLAEPYARA